MDQVDILGIRVTSCSKEQLNQYICGVIAAKRKECIPNVNIYCMNLCYTNKWLRAFLNSSELAFCDGDGVRLGAWMVGRQIEEKITYNRWIWDIAEMSASKEWSWYLLGSRPEAIESAVKTLERRYPDLRIVGFHSGYIKSKLEEEAVVAEINKSLPNILIVGMGMPLQEHWLMEHMSHLNVNVALTGGAVFDYLGGMIKRPPDILYKMKMEWLFRLVRSPRRLFGRYIIGNPLFLWRVIMYHWLHVRPRQEAPIGVE